jgi:hypothetical protein
LAAAPALYRGRQLDGAVELLAQSRCIGPSTADQGSHVIA